MLSKDKRLNLKKDFKRMIAGKFIDSKFAKFYIKLEDNNYPKVGISVSSKIFKKAVDRNRARRLISAAIEELYKRLPLNINILVLPKVSTLGVKSGDILIDLEEVLLNKNLLIAEP